VCRLRVDRPANDEGLEGERAVDRRDALADALGKDFAPTKK
jgi:hypothetical protein